MADSGPGIAGPMSSGGGSADADGRAGMLAINGLVYKLEPDLSVAVSRTHKIQFSQSQEYTNDQTMLFIVNSGADYIDPSRSWLTVDIDFPVGYSIPTPIGVNAAATASLARLPVNKGYLNFAFGPNGSVLNLIESVVVSSRSGDELSRVTNYGQFLNTYIPLTFGVDWATSIGSNIGFGSFIGADHQNDKNESRRKRFNIPLYLLSPFFNYGRLMPSMIMSGLRIEVRWKGLDYGAQAFWSGIPRYLESAGGDDTDALLNRSTTGFARFLIRNDLVGAAATYPRVLWPYDDVANYPAPTLDSLWTLSEQKVEGATLYYTLSCKTGVTPVSLGARYTAAQLGANHPLVGSFILAPGTTLVLPMNIAGAIMQDPNTDTYYNDLINVTIIHNDDSILTVRTNGTPIFTERKSDGKFGDYANGAVSGPLVLSQTEPTIYETKPGALAFSGLITLPNPAVRDYVIRKPHLQLASVQLTDAIQRVLNEFSSVAGLEIVFADFDHTSSPFSTHGEQNPVYLEIRKSASRALMAFARVINDSPNPQLYDSFASCPESFWNHYQWQLGSLYFPQQRVEDSSSDDTRRHDNVACVAYNYTLDAFDRLHPKSAPTMLSLRGVETDGIPSVRYHPLGSTGEHGEDTYLKPPSLTGKWGSFVNGGTTIATTLERSSAFDLSGIPTNNARVLALRANVGFKQPIAPGFQAKLEATMKFVRLARVFLLNVEVEQ